MPCIFVTPHSINLHRKDWLCLRGKGRGPQIRGAALRVLFDAALEKLIQEFQPQIHLFLRDGE